MLSGCLHERFDLARWRGVGIWLWRVASEPDPVFLDDVAALGAVGIKYDCFFCLGPDESAGAVALRERLADATASRRLMVNFHGTGKPTGEDRTRPNIMTWEAVRGLEFNTFGPGHGARSIPFQYATIPFTRGPAGSADFTPVTFDPVHHYGTSSALQLASAIAITSAVTHYADEPARYVGGPATDVMAALPAVWDETRVLPPSAIGNLAILARRRGNDWFLGVLNGTSTARTITVDLDFLQGPSHGVFLADDARQPQGLTRSERQVDPNERLQLPLLPGGGFVGWLRALPPDVTPSASATP